MAAAACPARPGSASSWVSVARGWARWATTARTRGVAPVTAWAAPAAAAARQSRSRSRCRMGRSCGWRSRPPAAAVARRRPCPLALVRGELRPGLGSPAGAVIRRGRLSRRASSAAAAGPTAAARAASLAPRSVAATPCQTTTPRHTASARVGVDSLVAAGAQSHAVDQRRTAVAGARGPVGYRTSPATRRQTPSRTRRPGERHGFGTAAKAEDFDVASAPAVNTVVS